MKATLAMAAVLASTLPACERVVTGTDLPAAPLQIDSSSLPDGQVDAPYAAALSASGGLPPYEFAIAVGALPAGLILAPDGTISGTPVSPGSSNFTAMVGDSAAPAQTSERSLSILVAPAPAPGPLAIATVALPRGSQGIAYEFTLVATGGTPPYAWSVSSGSLPDGLALTSGGLLSGIPSRRGTSMFTATVVDGAVTPQVASRQLSLTIQ
jgi:Putative Ig domain